MASQVVGDLAAALIFSSFNIVIFYLIMTSLSIIAAFVFSLLVMPKINNIEILTKNEEHINLALKYQTQIQRLSGEVDDVVIN